MSMKIFIACFFVLICFGLGYCEVHENLWKTYTNDFCGFSFVYPASWRITLDTQAAVGVSDPSLDRAAQEFSFTAACEPNIQAFIAQYESSPEITTKNISDYLMTQPHPGIRVIGSSMVSNLPATEVVLGGMSITSALWFEHGQVYTLTFPGVPDAAHRSAIQQKILASFTLRR